MLWMLAIGCVSMTLIRSTVFHPRELRRLPAALNLASGYFSPMNGYAKCFGGTNVSLIARGLVQRMRFHSDPALSFVPEALAPPKGWRPTTAPVGLSLT